MCLPVFLSFEGKAFFFLDAPASEVESLELLSLSLESLGLPVFLSFEGKAFFFLDVPALLSLSLESLELESLELESLELESLESDKYEILQ